MRILFLTQWFQPEPFIKGLPFARKLKAKGHEVEVLTGFPNYPGGKLYPGFRVRLLQKEVVQGIRVNRVALYPSHDRSGIKRMVNYLSFSLSSLILGPFVVKKPDVIYVFNLITLAWPALLIKKVSGCKIIYDVQDLWPESVSNSGMLKNSAIQGLLKHWCRWAYRQADKIAVLSPGFKKALVQRGVDPGRIEVIYNWSEETKDPHNGSGNSLKETYHLQNTFNVVFAGTMGVMQGLDTVLEAARLGGDEIPELRFVLVGDGVELERLKEKAVQSGLKNVVFIPRQPMSEMHRIWALADALLVHLVDDPLFAITIPSKTQAYLAAGIPIVMAVRGDAADLVHSARAGVACAPENPEDMLAAIKQLVAMTPEERKQMGRNGKAFYERFLSFEAGVEKFLRLIS